ncbi:hypothetical protein [Proteus mirabilis]|uniref:hypothetical protein n=1 Tax=Proteus mirabilis TaxID=584 RepID=UPI001BB004C8|nr:hypothetical protein [Proteus mirabilis]MBS3831924.1 hypothetical protein [Proteus mirabilis]MBU5403461.1 hypothetical protein [Proteus mirabilis]MCT0074381.1 hypothetical protein [Proteus mirabilis]MDF7281884.1 hypothetical protein [Proteus mirabilis]UZE70015.1 hypothetical protein ONR66_13950 [Proteus mirabilis]
MNDEILELAIDLKNKAKVLRVGYERSYVNLDTLIKICEYIEHVNNLQPVAWMCPVFHDEKMQFTTDAVTSENIDIHFQSHDSSFKVTPLYKLD